MCRLILSCLLLTAGASALAQPTGPKRIPPHPARARIESGQLHICRFQMEFVETPKSPIDLPVLQPNRPRFVSVMKPVKKSFPARDVRGYTATGKRIEASELRRKLKQDTLVLVALDGRKVDRFYLKTIAPETIILVPPSFDPNYGVKFPGIAPPR